MIVQRLLLKPFKVLNGQRVLHETFSAKGFTLKPHVTPMVSLETPKGFTQASVLLETVGFQVKSIQNHHTLQCSLIIA